MTDSKSLAYWMDDSYAQPLEIWRLMLVINVNFQREHSVMFLKPSYFSYNMSEIWLVVSCRLFAYHFAVPLHR